MTDAPDLAFVDVQELLRSLGDLTATDLILIGGQALNFWVDYYDRRGRLSMQNEAPFTSKDIDFFGSTNAMKECANRLNGQLRIAGLDDATASLGVVLYVDEHGVERVIDFIPPFGLREVDVRRTAQTVELLDEKNQPTGQSFRVLHPVWAMIGRAYNTVRLPGYRTEHALRQLRASIACARAFIENLLEEGHTKAVMKLNERIFSFCHWDSVGRELWLHYRIDAFAAAVLDARLPAVFRDTRYPQMTNWLTLRRTRAARPLVAQSKGTSDNLNHP